MINLAKDVNRSSCNYDIHTRTIIMNEISVNCTNIRCFMNTLYTLYTRKCARLNYRQGTMVDNSGVSKR